MLDTLQGILEMIFPASLIIHISEMIVTANLLTGGLKTPVSLLKQSLDWYWQN